MCKTFFCALLLGLLLPAIPAADAAQLYWNDANMIHRAALDGSGPQNLDPTYSARVSPLIRPTGYSGPMTYRESPSGLRGQSATRHWTAWD